jgi:hypothetical protein
MDALNRFAAGQDLRDPALLASAFAPDAELDFVQPARQLGVELPVFRASRERSGEQWAKKQMRIHNVWHRGDPKVRFP